MKTRSSSPAWDALLAVVFLGFGRPSAARGLKTLRAPGASSALSKLRAAHNDLEELQEPEAAAKPTEQLEAENKALKRRNKQLEGLMQKARGEVQKVSAAAKQQHNNGGNPEVLQQEVEDLRKKLAVEEADKKSLVQSLREMLAKNSMKTFQKQEQRDQDRYMNLAKKCGEQRQELQSQGKEAVEKLDEIKELSQSLQGQNVDLKRALAEARASLAKSEAKREDLSSDKANLLVTLHGLMSENGKAKQALQKEENVEKLQAQELTNDTAMIANLTGPTPKRVVMKAKPAVGKAVKAPRSLMHHKREESMAAQMAHLRDINRYIDRVYTPDDEADDAPAQGAPPAPPSEASDWTSAGKQVDTLQKPEEQEDIFVKGNIAARTAREDLAAEVAAQTQTPKPTGLSGWLGLSPQPKAAAAAPKDKDGMSPIDALDPEAVQQEKQVAAQQEKADADDGGAGIQDLLGEANSQLAVMDKADDETEAETEVMP